MAKWRERICQICREIQYTASKSEICKECYDRLKKQKHIENEEIFIGENLYQIADGPWLDKFNHRCYKLITPCGHEWSPTFEQFWCLIDNAEKKQLYAPCGTCGPKRRMQNALEGYIAKYGIDYDITKFRDYDRKVRGLTEYNYKHFKHIINPNNLPRGLAGVDGAHHLDHIVAVITCFKEDWSIEKAAAVENLQMLPWPDNLSKGSKDLRILIEEELI